MSLFATNIGKFQLFTHERYFWLDLLDHIVTVGGLRKKIQIDHSYTYIQFLIVNACRIDICKNEPGTVFIVR